MANWAADGAISSAPEWAVDELRKGIATVGRAVGEVFGDEFPAVVPGSDDVFVGTIKERDVGFVPGPVAVIPPGLRIECLLLIDDFIRFHGSGWLSAECTKPDEGEQRASSKRRIQHATKYHKGFAVLHEAVDASARCN